MSDAADDNSIEIVDVDVRTWVEAAKANPVRHRDRQVTEIVLTAIGIAPKLHDVLVLKGGAVMALAFKSNRVTADVDFSTSAPPENFAEMITTELDSSMIRAARSLGYLDLICRVQSVKKMPKPATFEESDFPALALKVGSAIRGTNEEKRLSEGQAVRTVLVEISFRDQVYAFQELNLSKAGVAVRAFTLHEIIAEKFRALLQQPIRNRNRRQDVFDIAYLLDQNALDDEDLALILKTFIEKCRTRNITPTQDSIDDPEVASRAEKEWDTLALELGELPPFAERFQVARELYVSLPWEQKALA